MSALLFVLALQGRCWEEVLGHGPGGVSRIGLGFGYSVYFFLTLLFSIAGVIVFVVARTIAREERQRLEREASRASSR